MDYDESIEIVPVTLPDGTTARAEVVMLAGDVSDGFGRPRLDDVRKTFVEVGRWVSGTVREAVPDRPETIEVTFGVKLAMETGKLIGVLAKANAEASLTVKMGWTLSPPGGSTGVVPEADAPRSGS